MKKIFCIILSFAFICSIYSCKEKKKITLHDEERINYISLVTNGYKSGRIYGNNPVMYIDYNTMESAVLCSKPNCTHKDSTCVAKMAGDCPLLYKDYLYFFESIQNVEESGDNKREYRIRSKLCRISLDSSEKEDIVSFTDCVPRDYDGYLICDNVIYFTGDNMNPIQDEYGNISVGNQGGIHYFCSIDLNTKKYTNYGSVYDGDKEYEAASSTSSAVIKGYYDSKIMIRYEFAKETPPLQVDENFDYRDVFTELMFEFDPENKNLKPSDLPEPFYVDENTYVYSKNNKTYVINDGNTYEFDCNETFGISFLNNKFFDGLNGRWFDVTDMSEHSMGEYKGYDVIAVYDNSYILRLGNKTVKLTEEELLALDKEN